MLSRRDFPALATGTVVPYDLESGELGQTQADIAKWEEEDLELDVDAMRRLDDIEKNRGRAPS